ncbi:MAG TPA: Fis family transcriptional regulator [Nitratifractor sp.]|nr:Fis family transcriptional regulator [Nitratifractor sp.]HHH21111.1 Fis family transcriptional regulator [Nitratifractor sp.]
MHIISRSAFVNKIYQSLQSTKELYVSSILYGDEYTGKKSLVKELYSSSTWVSGEDLEQVQNALANHSQIVITDFEKISNIDTVTFGNSNIVAISNRKELDSRIEDKFAFIYRMPPLTERDDDTKLYTDHFTNEAKELFNINADIEIKKEYLDLSKNIKSLKSSIYKSVLLQNLSSDDICHTLYSYFIKNYNGANVYKDQLELFEKPLIDAGLELYKSQLKLSEVLGINRNTLRKKINEYS